MTVKLAKLFGSSSSSKSSNNGANIATNSVSVSNNDSSITHHNLQQQAPPLPPPNANMKLIKYYDHHHHHHQHQPAAMTIYGRAYECSQMVVDVGEDEEEEEPYDDYDDNMSLSSACMQRNHPYNNSQRPLLGDRRTTLAKKKGATTVAAATSSPMAGIPLPAPPLPPQRSHIGGTYVSPYVQQQKRDSVKGLHGFNDFDTLSQQYNQHLQSSPHIGYPYGSPPSPTAQSSDFCFDNSNSNINSSSRQREQSFKAVSSSSSTDTTKSNCSSNSAANGSPPRYGNVPYPDLDSQSHQQQQQHQQQHQHQTSSRFEDDFCTRRNLDFVGTGSNVTAPAAVAAAAAAAGPGPFIFGISHEQQQTDYGRQRCSNSSSNSNGNGNGNGNGNSNSNNNNLNQPVINATPIKEHNALCEIGVVVGVIVAIVKSSHSQKPQYQHHNENGNEDVAATESAEAEAASASASASADENVDQQSLSNTSADSGKGAKFLLRKRKSKKTPAAAAAAATTTTKTVATNGDQTGKADTQPSIKCVLVGDGAVGKTNLILSYLENRFNPEHVPTASDIYNAEVNVNESPVHLTLCDTAGQDTLDPLRELSYPDSDVFLLCFSVVKPETFGAIKSKWAPKFAKTKAALILVGTQADLRSNLNVLNKLQTNGEKPISYADAWDLATTIGAKYIETSSATQDKVKDVFDTAIWEGLVPTTLPPTPSFWRKLFCLA
ncbi:GH12148 [Drosophila grimshawi]|uniref:GH12148 n=1 Tax=Drosophila grimshawi TaxID=7222 RepID=B4JJZ1_DROGR|nr:GH12148 [Drosophila grimshawi]